LTAIDYSDSTKNAVFAYDTGANGIGRLARMTDASGGTDYGYDTRGNLVAETRTIDGRAYATGYTYDNVDRVHTITYPSGTTITYSRDAGGRIDTVSATTGGVTQTIAGNIAYLPFGPIAGLDYRNGLALSRVFDQDYRLTGQTAGAVQDVTLHYDPADNITSLTDGLDGARTQHFVYDGLNRLTQAQGLYGTHDYLYDRIGNRVSRASSAGVDTYDYTPGSHHLETITGPNRTAFDYDANGNTVAKGPLGFTYDATNRLTEVLASGVPLTTYTYNARGERVKKTGAAGGTPSESVLFSDAFTAPDATAIDDQPDGAWKGKRPKATISATVEAGAARVAPGQAIRTTTTFTDTGDTTLVVHARLVQGTLVLKHPGAPRGVRIRFNGTRRVAVTSGAFGDETQRTKVVFRLPAPSHYVDIALHLRAGTTRVVTTDDQGANHDTGDMHSTALGTDDAYRLKLRAIKVKSVPVPGVFDDIRISRRTDTGSADTTHFVYDQGGRLIGEYAATGTPIAEYVYLADQPLAMLRGGAIYYYHTDHLGTPQALTDQDRRLVWRANYTPFGDTIISVDDVENPLRFPGQYFDAATGLYYNYFRHYDPSNGRYTQSDPIGLRGGTNTYSYVRENPIRFDDRFGLESFDGRDLGALVPTGASSIGIGGNFGMISASADTIDGTTATRSNLFPDFGVFVQFCERPTCDAPENRRRNPFPLSPDGADKISTFIFPLLRGIGIEFRPDGTQCFLISVGIGSPANQTVQLSPLPDLDFLELF
jgi:RHS repeat-associated protein